MPDKKITELTQIVTIANNDVLPIVDISENITKKIDIAQLKAQSPVQSVNAKVGVVTLNKGDIGLSEVDNTSDANKPISTATQTALDAKQDTLVSGTTIKTINSSSILGSGNISVAPSTGIDATAISTGVVSNAEFNYLDGVTSGIQAQLDNKVDENAAILAATKTKITYDAKGLITSGADATTADIASSSDKRYVTDAQLVVVANTSGINTGDQTLAGLGGVAANTAIVGATKTKISYDSKGLVTSGADATTADIADSTNKRYVTDANLTTIANTSGTNSGDNATNTQYSGLAASKQDALTLTTTGSSGAATLIGATLNIPQYSGGGSGTVTSVAALTLGTTGTDLSSTVANSTTTPVITLNVPTASATNRGALSSADWTTFNNKAPSSGIDATAIADGSVTSTEFQYINTLTSNAQTQIDTKSAKLITTNRQTASYTLVIGDADKLVEMNVGTANNLTIPLNSSVAYSIGTQILLAQYGAGQTTVVATGGVTVRSSGSKLKLNAQYSGATLIKIATDEWYLFGDIAA
jgi:hypothetical protein